MPMLARSLSFTSSVHDAARCFLSNLWSCLFAACPLSGPQSRAYSAGADWAHRAPMHQLAARRQPWDPKRSPCLQRVLCLQVRPDERQLGQTLLCTSTAHIVVYVEAS
ncbi:hypothetical protein BDV98DRAFT_577269 [Pterulicium gracile]|uniref:Uncharacterized protein n=1 Tax=Pterulicium gracile TaxID=1884261 RepID=A0A5C3Q3M0_9AGAR|nr:hypothetical protein BDV98DRAFT_577269 [Pterula gracilis]